jgi:hypothetical protein
MSFAAVAGGLAAAVGGAVVSGAMSGGGGGGGSTTSYGTTQNGSIGQGIGDILAGGLSSALGIQGLAGGNLNQLQSGAAAANPFGSQSNQYYGALQQMLMGSGGIVGASASNQNAETSFLQNILPGANINTNLGGLNSLSAPSTPGQTATMQSLINNPTQLISTLQGGGVGLPSGISAILNQNPYQLTSGQQFQETQGLTNLNRSLAQTGQLGSGNQYAAAEQYGQNFASQAVQTNISNLLNAQGVANSTSTTNQGLQSLVNQMGQNQFGNAANLSNILTGQQQSAFSNQLGLQQLQSTQQQNSQQNLQNLLQLLGGINQRGVAGQEAVLPGLLTATQASSSSPATAGGILANLGVANQASGSNIASGLGGLASGVGSLLQGVNFGSGGSGGGINGTYAGGETSTSVNADNPGVYFNSGIN